jgi:hypothetical protein
MEIKVELKFETLEEAQSALEKLSGSSVTLHADTVSGVSFQKHPGPSEAGPSVEISKDASKNLVGAIDVGTVVSRIAPEPVEKPSEEPAKSSGYREAALEAQHLYGADILIRAQRAAGNIDNTGEPLGIGSDPMKESPAKQFAFLAELDKLKAKVQKRAEPEAPVEPVARVSEPTIEKLTKETYLAELEQLKAVIGDQKWATAARLAGSVTPEGKARHPGRIGEDEREKWPGILAGLRKIATEGLPQPTA